MSPAVENIFSHGTEVRYWLSINYYKQTIHIGRVNINYKM
jgi:hypothetical protein